MNKQIITTFLIGVIIFLVSCQAPEALEGDAAKALEQLSDEELQQLADQSNDGKAIAG